jgi:glutathione synthase/RimK-type ligase-like ATP-grasp enzyme
MSRLSKEFEERLSWDATSLAQLVILNPADRYRAIIDRGTDLVREALHEAVAAGADDRGNLARGIAAGDIQGS